MCRGLCNRGSNLSAAKITTNALAGCEGAHSSILDYSYTVLVEYVPWRLAYGKSEKLPTNFSFPQPQICVHDPVPPAFAGSASVVLSGLFDDSRSHSRIPVMSIFQSTDLRTILHRSIKLPELARNSLWGNRAVARRLCGAERAFYSQASASPRRGISWGINQEVHIHISSNFWLAVHSHAEGLLCSIVRCWLRLCTSPS